VLDVFGAGWVEKRLFQVTGASLLLKMKEDPAYCSWTRSGSPQTISASSSNYNLQEQGTCHRPQETHCATAYKLAIPNFLLVGSVLSRKHGLATFVHEQLL